MVDSLQCPRCSGTHISRQPRYRNAQNGNSVGRWFPGCVLQLVIISVLVAAGGVLVRIYQPEHPFAEAALLTAAIAVVYAIGVGIFGLWIRRWPVVDECTCDDCGNQWYEPVSPQESDVQDTGTSST